MTVSATKVNCQKCGNNFHPNFRICPNCGTIIDNETKNGLNNNSSSMPSVTTPQNPKTSPYQKPAPIIQPLNNSANSGEWEESPVTPWRRWAARVLDLGLNSYIMGFALGFVFFQLAPYEANQFFSSLNSPTSFIFDQILSTLMGSMLTGLIIGTTGSSLGKIIFGIKVDGENGLPIGAYAGLKRDLEIWFKGIGLGVPIVNLFTLGFAYKRLVQSGSTSWDDGKYKIRSRPNGLRQYIFNAIGITILFLLYALHSVLRQMYTS